jgi:hypothetical protein
MVITAPTLRSGESPIHQKTGEQASCQKHGVIWLRPSSLRRGPRRGATWKAESGTQPSHGPIECWLRRKARWWRGAHRQLRNLRHTLRPRPRKGRSFALRPKSCPAKHGGLGGWDLAGHRGNAALAERFPAQSRPPSSAPPALCVLSARRVRNRGRLKQHRHSPGSTTWAHEPAIQARQRKVRPAGPN